jgi:Outer membrane protein TOM13
MNVGRGAPRQVNPVARNSFAISAKGRCWGGTDVEDSSEDVEDEMKDIFRSTEGDNLQRVPALKLPRKTRYNVSLSPSGPEIAFRDLQSALKLCWADETSTHNHSRERMSEMVDPAPSSPQTDTYHEEEGSYPSDLPSSTSSNSSTSLVAFYRPPTFLSLLRTTAINLILPFINGVMLGFGEIFAHELAFRWGWRGAKVP